MNVLITGGSGLLGRYLIKTAPKDYYVVGTYRNNIITEGGFVYLDITDEPVVDSCVKHLEPDVIIHAAAIGSVDYCQKHWGEAYSVNVEGAVNVAKAAAKYKVKEFVYISSNAVYDIEDYIIQDDYVKVPANSYGKIKVEAERSVAAVLQRSKLLIVRPIMLYGWPYPGGRSNWVTRILEVAGAGLPMEMVTDVTTQPTYAYDCARVIWDLLGATGSYNVGGSSIMTIYNYALAVAREWGIDEKLILPVTSDHFQTLAKRPSFTAFAMDGLAKQKVVIPAAINYGLKRMHDELPR